MLDFSKSQVSRSRQTSNGKLLGETDKLEAIDSQLASLTQQVECLGSEIIAAEQLDRKEYIKQLKLLRYSVQSMERIYTKLLLATLGTAVFTVFGWCVVLHRKTESNKSQYNPAAVAFTLTSLGGHK
jgi:RNA-binding protein YhbY